MQMITGIYPDIELISLVGATEVALASLENGPLWLYSLDPSDSAITITLSANITLEEAREAPSGAYSVIDSVNRWAQRQVEKGVSAN